MHNLNVRILGPSSFISTLNELNKFLKFNPLEDISGVKPHIIFYHVEALNDKKSKIIIDNNNVIKICAGNKKEAFINCDAFLNLPASLKEINAIVENLAAKKKFNKNSSIEIKDYLLNKNEKKLSKLENFLTLTEKEVQLLELLLNNKKPISKDNILSSVWNYSAESDTHTVETHIYRLRKKIKSKFGDEDFILNNASGYSL